MHAATQGMNVGVMKVLVEHGANVNARNADGDTPVHWAAHCGHVGAIKELVALGVDINTPNNEGRTPAHMAAQEGHVNTIKVLVKLGANIAARDNAGYTPMHAATEGIHVDVMKTLVKKHGADVNTRDDDGCAPIHHAAVQGHVKVIKVLAKLGADITTPDSSSLTTPMLFALSCHETKAMNALIKLGADITDCMLQHTPDAIAFQKTFGLFCASCEASNCPETQALFSLTKLMTSVLHSGHHDNEDTKAFIETAIASSFLRHLTNANVLQMHDIRYPLKRRLTRLASRVYHDSLLFDGDRISQSTKARRYANVCMSE
jgi:hypothetical protein